MGYRYHVDSEQELGVVHLYGEVTVDQVIDVCHALLDDPHMKRGYADLWDGRAINRLVVSPEDLQPLARLEDVYHERAGPGRTAVVVAEDVAYAIVKLIMALIEYDFREVHVFRSLDAAVEWLGVAALDER